MNPTPAILAENLVKRYPIFRGFREALTYKFSFVSSFAGILLSSATFYFVAKLVPPGTPSLGPFGGDYFSFAAVGVAFSSLLPVTCALDGMRKCLLSSAGFAEVLPDIAALAVFNIILLPASLPVFSAPLIC